MAQYSSYKKVSGATLPAGSVTPAKLAATGLDTWNVKWVYGNPVPCTTGCCCLWTVPTGGWRTTKVVVAAMPKVLQLAMGCWSIKWGEGDGREC